MALRESRWSQFMDAVLVNVVVTVVVSVVVSAIARLINLSRALCVLTVSCTIVAIVYWLL